MVLGLGDFIRFLLSFLGLLNNLVFKYFTLSIPVGRLFPKYIVHTKFDSHVFILKNIL